MNIRRMKRSIFEVFVLFSVTSLMSPAMESLRLSGIDEEQQCLVVCAKVILIPFLFSEWKRTF